MRVEEPMGEVSDEKHRAARGARRRPTITDVAALTGLSKATVSRALNDRDRVSAATRARVLATLEEIGYIRSHAAASLSTGRTGLLGLVVGANRNPTVLSAMHGALSAAGEYGVVIYVSQTDAGHDTIYGRLLASRAVDGVVHLFPRAADEPMIRSLQRGGVPVVVVEPEQPFAGVSAVWPDSFDDGYVSTAHLLAQGHTRIAICADTPGWGREGDYVEGYHRALADASVEPAGELVAESGWDHAAGYAATVRWLDLDVPPSAACFCCDTAAFGAIACARDRGLRIPDDLAVVGYDDTEVASWVAPALTTLRQRRTSLVAEAFTVLTAILDGAIATPVERTVRSELTIRGSSATRRR
jgi:LacI family transcriptional regulator